MIKEIENEIKIQKNQEPERELTEEEQEKIDRQYGDL